MRERPRARHERSLRRATAPSAARLQPLRFDPHDGRSSAVASPSRHLGQGLRCSSSCKTVLDGLSACRRHSVRDRRRLTVVRGHGFRAIRRAVQIGEPGGSRQTASSPRGPSCPRTSPRACGRMPDLSRAGAGLAGTRTRPRTPTLVERSRVPRALAPATSVDLPQLVRRVLVARPIADGTHPIHDSGRFAADGEAVRGHIQEPTAPSGAQSAGLIGDAPLNAAYETHDVVEPALARALVPAAEAARWELVARIANELEERRRLREGSRPSAEEHSAEHKVAQPRH